MPNCRLPSRIPIPEVRNPKLRKGGDDGNSEVKTLGVGAGEGDVEVVEGADLRGAALEEWISKTALEDRARGRNEQLKIRKGEISREPDIEHCDADIVKLEYEGTLVANR